MAKRYVKKKKKKRRSGFLAGAAVLFLAILVLVIVLLVTSSRRQDDPPVQAADALWDGSWYQDDLGLIDGDKALLKGMKTFEKRTGVKPFLTLLNGVDPDELDIFAQDQYDALFDHGGHLLVVYDEWEDDAYYLSARAGGTSALSQEDVAKVLNALEAAYADSANGTYAEAFGAGFARGAKAVTATVSAGGGVGLLLALGLVLLLLAFVLVLILRKRARAARREYRYMMEDED